jgi:uncharacterized protein (DUF488 family)
VFTVGHGTNRPEDFVDLLHRAGVDAVVDVRSYPGSRRHPWFAKDEMASWLREHGISYRWEPDLGGFRKPVPNSPNVALTSFRGYADHMRTDRFTQALARLVEEARRTPTAVMCAESLWWRCHRRLIADAAHLIWGVQVRHLLPGGRIERHRPMREARLDEQGLVVYDVVVDR